MIDSIVLAGGKSSRMGVDKAFLPFKGRSFLRCVLDTLSNISNKVIVVVNKDFSLYRDITSGFCNIKLVKDIHPYDGPLNGIVSAKDFITSKYVFIATCDTPFISKDAVEFFLENICENDAVIPVFNGKFQPLNTVYTDNALKIAKELFDKGEKSLMGWVNSLNKKLVYSEDMKHIKDVDLMFSSINTPKQYEEFIKKMGG